MNKIRLGIIGCGIAANELHLPALRKLSAQFKITAVCNHTEPKAVRFAQRVGGVPWHLDYHDLLARTDVDAVAIILPIHLNCQVTLDALKAGKHVILEKPLAADMEEAHKLVHAEKNTKLVTLVAENFRYRPGLHWLKKQIKEGVIGKPYAVFWNVFHLMDEKNKYAQTSWRINHRYPGGFITDGGIHNIAALRFLFGGIKTQQALISSVNNNIGEADSFTLQFVCDSQIMGTLNIFISTRGYKENKLLILGETGSVMSDGGSYTIFSNSKKKTKKFKSDSGYVEQLKDFYSAILYNTPVHSSFKVAFDDFSPLFTAVEGAIRV